MRKLSISITQRYIDGRLLGVETEAKVLHQEGTDEEVTKILLEAERHSSQGAARVHIFVKKQGGKSYGILHPNPQEQAKS